MRFFLTCSLFTKLPRLKRCPRPHRWNVPTDSRLYSGRIKARKSRAKIKKNQRKEKNTEERRKQEWENFLQKFRENMRFCNMFIQGQSMSSVLMSSKSSHRLTLKYHRILHVQSDVTELNWTICSNALQYAPFNGVNGLCDYAYVRVD